MRRIDALFLATVLICATLLAGRTITQSVSVLGVRLSVQAADAGIAGQSRDVDMAKLKRLLRQGELSNKEAEFYEPKK